MRGCSHSQHRSERRRAASGPAEDRSRSARWQSAEFRLPAWQQGIAEELGLSRVTVNRAPQHLARTGSIGTRARLVLILEPAALVSMSAWLTL
jgi:CRP-like cAMP-binding protein